MSLADAVNELLDLSAALTSAIERDRLDECERLLVARQEALEHFAVVIATSSPGEKDALRDRLEELRRDDEQLQEAFAAELRELGLRLVRSPRRQGGAGEAQPACVDRKA